MKIILLLEEGIEYEENSSIRWKNLRQCRLH